jgi:hypothetical protein
MSVLKKIQFAGQAVVVDAGAIIGAGAAECQKSVHVTNGTRNRPCFIAAR